MFCNFLFQLNEIVLHYDIATVISHQENIMLNMSIILYYKKMAHLGNDEYN